MVATFSNLKKQDREYDNFQEDDAALAQRTAKPVIAMSGGAYRASLPTYTDGDAAMMHFTSDGKLMVDTELTVDGNVIVDNVAVWATNIADSSTAGFALIDANGHPQVDVLSVSGEATHDSAVTAVGPQVMAEAKDYDGAALPNTVQEGDAVRTAATLSGISYSFLTTHDGSATPLELENDTMDSNKPLMVTGHTVADFDGSDFPILSDTEGKAVSMAVSQQGVQFVTLTDDTGSDTPMHLHDLPIGSGKGEKGVMTIMEAKTFDGSALPNNVAEGDAVRPAASEYGVQYMFPVTEDGANTPISEEDDSIFTGQACYLSGVKRKDYDGAALSTDANTEGDAVIPAASAQGVQFVTVVSPDGSSKPAYDSGTDSMKMFNVAPETADYSESSEDFTNVANATPEYHYVDMRGYRNLVLQWVKDAGTDTFTITVEAATSFDGGSDITALDYADVTQYGFTASTAATAASYTADGMAYLNEAFRPAAVRVKITTAGGSDDADFAIVNRKSN